MEDDSPQIKAIRARYKTGLHEKAELIEQYKAELCDGCSENAHQDHALFRAELHKLAGSSGMYGYHDVCDLCRHAMSCIDNKDLAELTSAATELHELLLRYSKG